MWDIELKLIDADSSVAVARGRRWEEVEGEGGKYMVVEDDLTLSGGRAVGYTGHTAMYS